MHYAGIGSRQTPLHILARMRLIGRLMAEHGVSLRSGAAHGADSAFEAGALDADPANPLMSIYLPWEGFEQRWRETGPSYHVTGDDPEGVRVARATHPLGGSLSGGALALMARNHHQLNGLRGEPPSSLVIGYHPPSRPTGGTLQNFRNAARQGIPVMNLADPASFPPLEKDLPGPLARQLLDLAVSSSSPSSVPLASSEPAFLDTRRERLFSNFYLLDEPIVDSHGIQYRTVENAYQAGKTDDLDLRRLIARTMGSDPEWAGLPAKRLKPSSVRPSFDRLRVMEWLLKKKFSQPRFADALRASGQRPIVEMDPRGNDSFWAATRRGDRLEGQNHLGRLLTAIRSRQPPASPRPIFVFGSNLRGIHGKGAALEAATRHGAIRGVGTGLQGSSYAIPTKADPSTSLPPSEIRRHIEDFVSFARANPHLVFDMTPVGTGLAGYSIADLESWLPRDLPPNIRPLWTRLPRP